MEVGVLGVALGMVVAIAVSGVTEAASLEQAARASSEMAASDEMSVFFIEEKVPSAEGCARALAASCCENNEEHHREVEETSKRPRSVRERVSG
jgi:hypothetical protein